MRDETDGAGNAYALIPDLTYWRGHTWRRAVTTKRSASRSLLYTSFGYSCPRGLLLLRIHVHAQFYQSGLPGIEVAFTSGSLLFGCNGKMRLRQRLGRLTAGVAFRLHAVLTRTL
jgi:hypothetical protein